MRPDETLPRTPVLNLMPAATPDQPGHYHILQKFAYLLSARGVRGVLETVFLLYLARHSTTTFGEFTLAFFFVIF